MLEKVVFKQLQSFLTENSIHEKFQSGFRARHSTETALLRVFNDLILTVDSGSAAILVTLDLKQPLTQWIMRPFYCAESIVRGLKVLPYSFFALT